MKQHIYTLDQINELYRYLMTRPMLEVEKYVTILRNPVNVIEVETPKAGTDNVETKEN